MDRHAMCLPTAIGWPCDAGAAVGKGRAVISTLPPPLYAALAASSPSIFCTTFGTITEPALAAS